MDTQSQLQRILTIDIGGSHIKAATLNEKGELLTEYKKLDTPQPPSPENVVNTILELVKNFDEFQKVSVGFPGYVRDGIVKTAPNLGTEMWQQTNLSQLLSEALHQPVKVVNDADLQGLGVASGQGLEMVITLGTGVGTALLLDGKLLPHLELSHHPIKKNIDYDQYVGEAELDRVGREKWNERMQKVLHILKTVINYDRLYISGGNAKKLSFKLDENVIVVSNKEGIRGGAKLWW